MDSLTYNSKVDTVDAGYKNTGYKNTGYKNTGYKNISVIRTIVCDPFLSFPIEKVGYKNILLYSRQCSYNRHLL